MAARTTGAVQERIRSLYSEALKGGASMSAAARRAARATGLSISTIMRYTTPKMMAGREDTVGGCEHDYASRKACPSCTIADMGKEMNDLKAKAVCPVTVEQIARPKFRAAITGEVLVQAVLQGRKGKASNVKMIVRQAVAGTEPIELTGEAAIDLEWEE